MGRLRREGGRMHEGPPSAGAIWYAVCGRGCAVAVVVVVVVVVEAVAVVVVAAVVAVVAAVGREAWRE